jgi:transglutaminase superfamily protein
MDIPGGQAVSRVARFYNDRYCALVQPHLDSVGDAIEEALGYDRSRSRQFCIERITSFVNTFSFESSMGKQTIEGVFGRRSGNCLGLACLLCSMLRRAGFSAQEVFVMIVTPVLKGLHSIHALTLVKQAPGLLLIDPETKKNINLQLHEISSRYSVYLIFNDQMQAFTAENKRAILTMDPAYS